MKTEFQNKLVKFAATAALLVAPLAAYATPSVTYNIGNGSSGGFSASYIHAATSEMGSSGYFVNGNKARVTGTLSYDLHAGTAGGSLTVSEPGDTNFGQGSDAAWTLTFTGSASTVAGMFQGGTVDSLLSLDYELSTNSGGLFDTGTFYFADRTFAGAANSISSGGLYLWGNNWTNQNGTSDRQGFVDGDNTPLGLDLYGVSVPEPGIVALLAMGLVGFGVAGRKKA